MASCPQCGAVYVSCEDNCAGRFEQLLALDHSRTEPWGSRHALSFSAFVLQHPNDFGREVLERAWLLLFSVYANRRDLNQVTKSVRRGRTPEAHWGVPPLPVTQPPARFAVTIADLGSFAAETYPAQLDRWCRAVLAALGELGSAL